MITFPFDGSRLGISSLDSAATRRAMDELSDAADSAERRSQLLLEADARTAPARFAIKALARSLTETEAMALIASVQNAIAESGWGHTKSGEAARESLTDAHWAIEQGENL